MVMMRGWATVGARVSEPAPVAMAPPPSLKPPPNPPNPSNPPPNPPKPSKPPEAVIRLEVDCCARSREMRAACRATPTVERKGKVATDWVPIIEWPPPPPPPPRASAVNGTRNRPASNRPQSDAFIGASIPLIWLTCDAGTLLRLGEAHLWYQGANRPDDALPNTLRLCAVRQTGRWILILARSPCCAEGDVPQRKKRGEVRSVQAASNGGCGDTVGC